MIHLANIQGSKWKIHLWDNPFFITCFLLFSFVGKEEGYIPRIADMTEETI